MRPPESESSSGKSFADRVSEARANKDREAALLQREANERRAEEARLKAEAEAAEAARIRTIKESPQWKLLQNLDQDPDFMCALEMYGETFPYVKRRIDEARTQLYKKSRDNRGYFQLFYTQQTDESFEFRDYLSIEEDPEHLSVVVFFEIGETMLTYVGGYRTPAIEYQKFQIVGKLGDDDMQVTHYSEFNYFDGYRGFQKKHFEGSFEEFLDYMAELVA